MTASTTPDRPAPLKAKPRGGLTTRAFWVRQILNWHWISAAISLAGILVFAITGITLNHAGDIAANLVIRERILRLPPSVASALAAAPDKERQPLPPAVAQWADEAFSIRSAGRDAEWSADEIYLPMARPGGDATLTIDRASGEAIHEDTWRGWIAYFNDLHKGRNTGTWWAWFIDIFAVACVVFSLTGFGLLWLKAGPRPSTWPLIAVGVVIPALIALLLIH